MTDSTKSSTSNSNWPTTETREDKSKQNLIRIETGVTGIVPSHLNLFVKKYNLKIGSRIMIKEVRQLLCRMKKKKLLIAWNLRFVLSKRSSKSKFKVKILN